MAPCPKLPIPPTSPEIFSCSGDLEHTEALDTHPSCQNGFTVGKLGPHVMVPCPKLPIPPSCPEDPAQKDAPGLMSPRSRPTMQPNSGSFEALAGDRILTGDGPRDEDDASASVAKVVVFVDDGGKEEASVKRETPREHDQRESSSGTVTPREDEQRESSATGNSPAEGIAESNDESNVNETREVVKSISAIVVMCVAWVGIFVGLNMSASDFKQPNCKVIRERATTRIRSCKQCGRGTNVLPLLGEFEKSWDVNFRAALYFFGLGWSFMGMGIVCDQFMAGIEAITDSERIIWRRVRGVRRKFRVKTWNPTVANLTLMALGSSAPEILLTAIELVGNEFYSASIGPQTIVGSAAFNLFIISAVCVTALQPPETKRIEGLDAFSVTATMSLIAYSWLLFILLVFSPQKVDIWEALVTFMLFPVLIVSAFIADKGYVRRLFCRWKQKAAGWDIEKERLMSLQTYGKVLPDETLHRLHHGFGPELTKALTKKDNWAASGALRRSQSGFARGRTWTSSNLGPALRKGPTVGFTQKRFMGLECDGRVKLKVELSKALSVDLKMKYSTRDGTAAAEVRYKAVQGDLIFKAGVTEVLVEVPLIDDDIWNPEETFMIDLDDLEEAHEEFGQVMSLGRPSVRSSLSEEGVAFSIRTAVVTILNDDIAGTLVFGADEVLAHQGTTAVLDVWRNVDCCGEVTCAYETMDDSAVSGSDYEPQQGILSFAAGEKHKTINIKIVPQEDRGKERFKVRLSNPTSGAVFDSNTDGGDDCAVCDVIIAAAGNTSICVRLLRMLLNEDRWEMAKGLWAEQRNELLFCGGSAEDQKEASVLDWVLHIIGLNWKIMFLLTPPPLLGGGWPCFVGALCLIGVVTTIAGDLASLLGCCLGIPDDITAITLVALGTSLPDTLASRTAAQHDLSADNAIGNITGSNSVNVFLGAGISWTMGALYWWSQGPTEEWQRHIHAGETYKDLFMDRYPDGGFIVPIPSLAFSVGLFTFLAFICLFLLATRRALFGGELGGLEYPQYRDAAILVSLWVIFIAGTSTVSVIIGD